MKKKLELIKNIIDNTPNEKIIEWMAKDELNAENTILVSNWINFKQYTYIEVFETIQFYLVSKNEVTYSNSTGLFSDNGHPTDLEFAA